MGTKRAKGGFAGRRQGCPSDGRPHQPQHLFGQFPLGLDKSLQNPVSCGLNVDLSDRGPGALLSELTVYLWGEQGCLAVWPRGRERGRGGYPVQAAPVHRHQAGASLHLLLPGSGPPPPSLPPPLIQDGG